MAHLAKFTVKDLGGLIAHNRRLKENETPNIDVEKTKLNHNILNSRCFEKQENGEMKVISLPQDDFQNYLKTLEHSKRKDLKCVCSWVVTLPDELLDKDMEMQKKFFTFTRQFMYQNYGQENLIMASEHFDEQGKPHMHYLFIPVKTYIKDNVEHKKVCAKEVLTKKHLQSFHSELSKYVCEKMQMNLSIENGKTQNGNKTINQLKTETLKKENTKLKAELMQAQEKVLFYEQGANQSMTFDEWYKKRHKARLVKSDYQKQQQQERQNSKGGMSR